MVLGVPRLLIQINLNPFRLSRSFSHPRPTFGKEEEARHVAGFDQETR